MNESFISKFPKFKNIVESQSGGYKRQANTDNTQFSLYKGDRLVFPDPEPVYSQARKEYYLNNPFRLSLGNVTFDCALVGDRWRESIADTKQYVEDSYDNHNVSASGLIFFDVGLTSELLEFLKVKPMIRTVMVLVRDVELFSCLYAVNDWDTVLDYMDEHGITFDIKVVSGSDSSAVMANIKAWLWSRHLLSVQSVEMYFHCVDPLSREIGLKLKYRLIVELAGLGFFEDELGMLRQGIENLVVRGGRVLDKQEPHDRIALIVGSGPSLDELIPLIKKYRAYVYIFACGTAIEPLMVNNILPDQHVLLERNRQYELYREMADRISLESVPLIASVTSEAELADIFQEVCFYFRGGLNTAAGFDADPNSIARGCDPTVSNAGLAIAVLQGFRTVIFAGVDMGTVDKARDHSENTLYDNFSKRPKYESPVEATFGGLAYANLVLTWAAQSITAFLRNNRSVRVFNLSDGQKIDGCLSIPPTGAEIFFACLFGRAPKKQQKQIPMPGSGFSLLLTNPNPHRYSLDQLDGTVDGIQQLIRRDLFRDADALKELEAYLWRSGTTDPYKMIFRGSITTAIWHAFAIRERVKSDAIDEVDLVLTEALSLLINEMRTHCRTTIELSLSSGPIGS